MSTDIEPSNADSIKLTLARVTLAQIVDGGAISLDLAFKAGRQSVIVTRKGDKIAAFINRCPHARWPLDTFDGRFLFTPEGDLMCAAHGALFHTISGACLGGPGTGAGLAPLVVSHNDGAFDITE
jgi:nitrite reductase/ring-hydroxylating ferredoxin subunit